MTCKVDGGCRLLVASCACGYGLNSKFLYCHCTGGKSRITDRHFATIKPEDDPVEVFFQPGDFKSGYFPPNAECPWPLLMKVIEDDYKFDEISHKILVRTFQIDWCDSIEIAKVNGEFEIYQKWNSNGEIKIQSLGDGIVQQLRFDQESKEYVEMKVDTILPKIIDSSTVNQLNLDNGKTIEKSVVQNAMFCSLASYETHPAHYITNIGDRFTKTKCLSLLGIKQQCVLAFCKKSETLYICLRGSVDLDDWMVNLTIEMKSVDGFGRGKFDFK